MTAKLLEHRKKIELNAHIPLSDAGLCIQCDSVFSNTNEEGCPACGAKTVFLLSSWVKPMKIELSLAQEILRT